MSAAISIMIAVVVLVSMAIGLCLLNDWFMRASIRRRNPPERLAATKRAYEGRLLHPDWEFYERHLQRPAPAGLRSIYNDPAFLLIENRHCTGFPSLSFCALDEPSRDECRKSFGIDVIPFANSHDNLIYLRPGPMEPDVVFITYHDGGDTEILAPDFISFYERLLNANRNG